MFEHNGPIPISMEIYEHIIKDLQEHSQKNEEVYHLQISTLKDQLKEKNQLIGEMSRRMGTLTSRTHSEQDPAQFDEEEDCSLSAFTVDKGRDKYMGGSLPGGGGTSRLFNAQNFSQASNNGGDVGGSQIRDIEEQTRCLKQQLNELFKTKQLESLELNRVIDELKNQLVDYQTEKISLCDINHQLATENARILTQLQEVTGACNHIRELADHQQRQVDELSHSLHGQAETIDNLNEQVRAVENCNGQLKQTVKEQQQTIEKQQAHIEQLALVQHTLTAEVQSLRKEKQAKKDHSEKQHRLIVQYEKKNEQNIKQIRRLEGDMATLHAQLEQLRVYSNKLDSESKRLTQQHERQLKDLASNHNRKLKSLSNRFHQTVRMLTDELREQLATVRQEVSCWPQWISEMALQATSVMQARSNVSVVTHSNISLFNREEMLEFEVEELRKELLVAKKENFELKYENKKLQNRRATAHEKQKELRAEIERLNEVMKREEQFEKLETENNQHYPQAEAFRLSDVGNRTAVQSKSTTSRGRKESKNTSRKESANDQRIIQEITEMRKRIKNVREECLTKTMK